MAEQKEKSVQKTEIAEQETRGELSPAELESLVKEISTEAQIEVDDFKNNGKQTAQSIAVESGSEVDDETWDLVFGLGKEADEAEDELRKAIIEEGLLKAAEIKEQEPITRREFDYRDKNGKLIGVAILELENELLPAAFPTNEGEPGKARILKSFVLKGEKAGKPTEIDMLAFLGTREKRLAVHVAEQDLKNYCYQDESKRVTIPPLESPIDVAVALHEFGHAEQWNEERFKKITPLYGFFKNPPKSSKELKTILEAVPEGQKLLPEHSLEVLEAAEESRDDTRKKLDALSEQIDKLKKENREQEDKLVQRALKDVINESYKQYETAWEALTPEKKNQPGAERQEVEKIIKYLESQGIKFPETTSVENEETPPFSMETLHRVISNLGNARLDKKQPFSDSGEKMNLELNIRMSGDEPPRIVKMEIDTAPKDAEFYKKTIAVQKTQIDSLISDERETGESAQKYTDIVKKRLAKLEDLIKLPGRMMERDATRRAFQWLRELRQKHGIDLFKGIYVKAEKLVIPPDEEETCADDVSTALAAAPKKMGIIASASQKELTRYLKSYGATTGEMRQRHHGKIPRVKK